MKPNLYIMIGIPGSGKSTIAKQLADQYNAVIHSSDRIREELIGDVNSVKYNYLVFETLHNRIEKDLELGKNVIYDATNISKTRRADILQLFPSSFCDRIAVFVATPLEQCLDNNNHRDRHVPEKVIRKMAMTLDEPTSNEGWKSIFVYNGQVNQYV